MVEYPKTKSIQSTIYTGTWSDKKIPVYTVTSANGLNQLVGYVKHINAANGTVLYRGQCNLHPRVIPSICRDNTKIIKKAEQLEAVLNAMSNDTGVLSFWHLNKHEIAGWKMYQKLTIEATLQHYGADTFCVDFVDNHWTALWFGLYRWNRKTNSYEKRESTKNSSEDQFLNFDICIDSIVPVPTPPSPPTTSDISKNLMEAICKRASDSGKPITEFVDRELNKMHTKSMSTWKQEVEKIKAKNESIQGILNKYHSDDNLGHMYLFLYVAETNSPTLYGVSMGEKTYTIDLRKALPSTFLRPCSQHGWIVREKNTGYCYEDRIACVIRINVDLVSKMLGKGSLVSEENFFPSEEYDQGYRVLLQRQKGTHIPTTADLPKILPENMISNISR